MPCASEAISPACGAGSCGSPKPMSPARGDVAGVEHAEREEQHEARARRRRSGRRSASSAACRRGCSPTLRSCSISPATADDTHTTAATPSTAATPLDARTPSDDHQQRGHDQWSRASGPRSGCSTSRSCRPGCRRRRRRRSRARASRSPPRTRPASTSREVEVERDHQHEHGRDPAEHRLRAHVALGALGRGLRRRPTSAGRRSPRLMPVAEVLAHAEQREARADQHAADRDRAHDEAPQTALAIAAQPCCRPRPCTQGASCGPRKKMRSGTSRPQARTPPAKFKRAELGSDDVADAEVGGAHAGAAKVVTPPACIVGASGARAEAHGARPRARRP